MATTDTEVLRDLDRRIAEMYHALRMENATLSANFKMIRKDMAALSEDFNTHRGQTSYYRKHILKRLQLLETPKPRPFITLTQITDISILARILVALVLAGTGTISVAEALRVAMD